jgi:hypothetical protein
MEEDEEWHKRQITCILSYLQEKKY